jgi:hypothetical protein
MNSALDTPQAYPKGEFMEVPRWPNVSVVNDLGDYAIKADRLAFIDGDCPFSFFPFPLALLY